MKYPIEYDKKGRIISKREHFAVLQGVGYEFDTREEMLNWVKKYDNKLTEKGILRKELDKSKIDIELRQKEIQSKPNYEKLYWELANKFDRMFDIAMKNFDKIDELQEKLYNPPLQTKDDGMLRYFKEGFERFKNDNGFQDKFENMDT